MDLSGQPTTNLLTLVREINDLMEESFEPRLFEVVTSLPKINRFNGHTTRPYSVAMHGFMCSYAAYKYHNLSDPHLRTAILLHDAAEAYVGDIVRPIKKYFNGDLAILESKIQEKILRLIPFTALQWSEIGSDGFRKIVKEIDSRMALTELQQLRPDAPMSVIPGFDPYEDLVLPESNWQKDGVIFGRELAKLTIAMREKENYGT